MLIPHQGHTDTIQVYSVTVMTHVKALQARHSSLGTSEPITPVAILEARFAPKTIGFFHYVLSMAMPNMKLIGEFMTQLETQLETPQAF